MYKEALKSRYKGILQRCNNPKNEDYINYGWRGIRCEWKTFESFYKDMVDSFDPFLSIDRKDNDLSYSPDNCHFTTPRSNSNNRRVPKCSKTLYAGVYERKNGRFRAYIRGVSPPMFGRLLHLGQYSTAVEAVRARNEFIHKHNLPNKIQDEVLKC